VCGCYGDKGYEYAACNYDTDDADDAGDADDDADDGGFMHVKL